MSERYAPRIKMMLDKLADQSSRGCIDNEWAETFIWDIKGKFEKGVSLTEKQISKIEQLSEQY